MLAVESSAPSLSDDQLAAVSPWSLGLGWRCGPLFPRVSWPYQLPQPQDLLCVPAHRSQA